MIEQDSALPPAGQNSPDNGSPDNDAPEVGSSNQSSRPSVEERAADCIDGLSSRLGTLDLARGLVDWEVSRNAQRHVLGHYVAAAHGMMMELCAEARGFLGGTQPDSLADQVHKRALTAARLAGTGARFMERIRLGVQSLNGLAPDGDGSNGGGPDGGERNVIYHMIEGTDDLVRKYEFDLAKVLAAGGSGMDMPNSENSWIYIVRPDANRGAASARRGRLKNGNRSGDFLAAPRCGARTRAGGCCRQPAMANGRCRLHGRLSTGPRTAEGLARSRAARLSHGCSTAKVIDLRRAATALGRRFDRALAAARTNTHGAKTSDSLLPVEAGLSPAPSTPGHSQSPAKLVLHAIPDSIRVHPSPQKRGSSAAQLPCSAGHGVDRAFFGRAAGRLGGLQQKQGRQPQEREESQHIRGGRQKRPRAHRRIHA